MARVLFTSCPAYGHVLPLLPLIRAAERDGHDVRVATGENLVGALTTRGLDVHAVGPSWATAWSAHSDVWRDESVPEEQRMLDGVVALFGTPALRRLDDLTAMAAQWRPDVVVHEVLEHAGSMLAHRLGVPGVVHGIGPMFPSYPALIDAAGVAIGEPRLWEHVSSEQAIDLCPPALQPLAAPPWPAASSVQPSAGEWSALPTEVTDFLATGRPVAYFTLGTVSADSADFQVGLQSLAGFDGVVVATTGRRTGLDELGPVPANVLVAEFLPQASMLEHTDLLVSHSGSGTMLGGLVHGVPQVALPRGTDQPENAALLVRAGAGLAVAPEHYAVESIVAAVTAVAHDPSYRTAANRVRDQIAAMPDADTAWAGLAF